VQVVPALNGWGWIKAGFALFRVQPVVWIALAFAYWSIMSLVAMIPFIGMGASLVLVPLFAVSFMNIARGAERGQRPEFQMLASGFRERPRPLVGLGVVYLVLHLVLLVAVVAVMPEGEIGDLRRAADGGAAPGPADGALFRALLLAGALYVPVVAAFWYAPVLVAWEGQSPGKSLFFSFFAVLANWRAFLVYGIAATVLASLLLGAVVLVLGAFAADRQAGPQIIRLALPLYVATLMPVLFASFYASYRDVFPPPGEAPKALPEQGPS
jgi:hypothetical protein